MKIENAKIREATSMLSKPGMTSRTSVFSGDRRSEINYISIDSLVPYHKQARRNFNQEDIDELASTIREHGIRQPLTVLRADVNDPEFEVISGERRLRAAKQLGMRQVPCIIITDSDKAEEIALIENIQRKDLHPIELARGLKTLIDNIGRGGQLEVEKRLGISQSRISENLSLLSLSESVQECILEKNYRGRDNFRKLLKIKDEESQLKIINGGSAVNNRKVRTMNGSVLRISISDNTFKIQKSNLSKLNGEQKNLLRTKLLELLQDLS